VFDGRRATGLTNKMASDVNAFRTFVETTARKRTLNERCREERRAVKDRLDAVANALRQARSLPVTDVAAQNASASCTLYAYRMPDESYVSYRRMPARARFHTLAEIERCLDDVDTIAAALRRPTQTPAPAPAKAKATAAPPPAKSLSDRIADAMIEASRDRSSTATRFARTVKRPRGKQLAVYEPTPNENALLTSFCALDDQLVDLRRKRKRVVDRIERALEAVEEGAVRYVEATADADADADPAAAEKAKSRTARIDDPDAPGERVRYKVAIVDPPAPTPPTPSPAKAASPKFASMWMSRPALSGPAPPGSPAPASKEPDVARALRVRIGDMRSVVVETLERMIPATVRARDDHTAVLWLRQNRDRVVEAVAVGMRALGAANRAVARPDVRPAKRLRICKLRSKSSANPAPRAH